MVSYQSFTHVERESSKPKVKQAESVIDKNTIDNTVKGSISAFWPALNASHPHTLSQDVGAFSLCLHLPTPTSEDVNGHWQRCGVFHTISL